MIAGSPSFFIVFMVPDSEFLKSIKLAINPPHDQSTKQHTQSLLDSMPCPSRFHATFECISGNCGIGMLSEEDLSQWMKLDDLITENQCRLDLILTFGRYEDSPFFSAFATLMFDTREKLIK